MLNKPYTDVDAQRTTTDPATHTSVSYRYIHGGFTGSKTKFAFYFPAKAQYQGRFFESTYPTVSVEAADPATIVFAISNGAYVVSTNNNGGLPAGLPLSAYRANAAAAKYSRLVAAKVYGNIARPRGYIYGASGGAYQTIGAVENTQGIWDGAVPMVPGTPNSIPSNQAIQLLGLRVLHDKLPEIAAAMEPGGSGNPYEGLTTEQQQILKEVTRLGFPLTGWWQYATLTGGSFSAVEGGVRSLDPTYAQDFWTKPGYEGTSDPSVRAARVMQTATIVSTVLTPSCKSGQVIGTICPAEGVVLSNAASGPLLTGADLTVTSGAAKGKTVTIDTATSNTILFAGGSDPSVTTAIRPGDTVQIDNSWVIALQYYPRHQVPSPDTYGWNQYLGTNGKPLYPQRTKLLGPTFTTFTEGSVADGHFDGKMIMLASVDDVQAFAWSADWYRRQAQAAIGSRFNDNFRIYYMDNTDHDPTGPAATSDHNAGSHIVAYTGELQQALLDLDAWVVKGTRPPASTKYTVTADNGIQVPPTASARKGLQPVVSLTADGSNIIRVKVGQTVRFNANAELPDGTGKIVVADWDFNGTGAFPQQTKIANPAQTIAVSATHAYNRAGSYLAVIRIAANRNGKADSPYGQIENLARVRVIVS